MRCNLSQSKAKTIILKNIFQKLIFQRVKLTPPPPHFHNMLTLTLTLHAAIKSKDESRAKALVEEGDLDELDEGDHKGNTALIYAVWKGLPSIVGILLRRGVDLTKSNLLGANALHVCATHGDGATATILVEAGANVETVGSFDGARPLHMAAQAGNVEVVQVFLSAGAMVDARTSKGRTALYMAAYGGHARVFSLLFRSKASLGLSALEKGFSALEFLKLSSGFCNPEILSIICDAGVVDFRGYALCHAVTMGREESVKILLQHSCERERERISEDLLQKLVYIYVNSARDASGASALECCFKESSLRPRILRRLIDAGIDTDQWFRVDISPKDKDVRLQGMLDDICRAPAVRAVSWGWPQSAGAKSSVVPGAKSSEVAGAKTIFLKNLRPTKPRPRVVWAAAFRKKNDVAFLGYEDVTEEF